MPTFDRSCLGCGWQKIDSFERADDRELPCPTCGHATVRVWTTAPAVIPDTFTTPLVDHVMDRHPQVFHSRSEHAAAMKARGLMNRPQHVGAPGSDKSKHTTRWI